MVFQKDQLKINRLTTNTSSIIPHPTKHISSITSHPTHHLSSITYHINHITSLDVCFSFVFPYIWLSLRGVILSHGSNAGTLLRQHLRNSKHLRFIVFPYVWLSLRGVILSHGSNAGTLLWQHLRSSK